MKSFPALVAILLLCVAVSLAADAPLFDKYKFAGLPPDQAAKEMTLREGFSVKLFAGEPDVRQPVAMALDARGRIWVAEAYTYPRPAPEGEGKDRIVVFEDADGDGQFDHRTVFIEGLNLVSGLEIGFGGVWVGAAPKLLFIPADLNADRPAPKGEARVLLDGWGSQDTHEVLNTFAWGPDGWLYGCQGVFTQSKVGKPGAPDSERTRINAGIWRYHPQRQLFELFAEGTSNPWGVDFNDYGQAFATACVIPHLFHVVQGARYHRQAGQHFNPFTFDDIKTCADHLHYGSATPHAGNRRSDAFGGGHAHCGAMIYLGGSWPAEYRGEIFMNNIHGARLNMDKLERAGSGWVGHHGPDFLLANDEWSQFINLRYGPDGSAFVIDWYDKQACHTNNPEDHDRTNGRIFKITYGDAPKVTGVNLAKLSSAELVARQLSPNDWDVRTARRLLQERGRDAAVHSALREILEGNGCGVAPADFGGQEKWKTTRELRALWALDVTGGLDEETLLGLLGHNDEWLRAWAVQLLCEAGAPPAAAVPRFAQLAATDPSPVVRLYLATAAQRVAPEQRWDLIGGLLSHGEDAEDHNLPLMGWYAAEPLAAVDAARALQVAIDARLPRILNFMSRRITALGTADAINLLSKKLGEVKDGTKQLAILQGMDEALRTMPKLPLPDGWQALTTKLADSRELRSVILSVSVKLGSADALAALRKQLATTATPAKDRTAALDALLAVKDPDLAPTLQLLLDESALRAPALRALARYDEPGTGAKILAVFPALSAAERRDALASLAARPAWARELVSAVEKNVVSARDLSAETVRQIRQLGQSDLNSALDRLWGAVRENPAEKQREIARYKTIYQQGYSTPGDPRRGRAIFARTCAACHTLFGEGGKVGPEITGANRSSLDYLLENIVTPNAVVPNDYRAAIIATKDGRNLMGPIKQQDAQSVTVAMATESVTLPRSEIASLQISETSMMPEGLLTPLNEQEVRDLLYYLMSPAQVPLPEPEKK